MLWVSTVYYSLLKIHELILLVSVLHPRHKLEYFKTAAWEDDWIETAEGLVCDEFERSYSACPVSDQVDDGMDVDNVTAAPVCFHFC